LSVPMVSVVAVEPFPIRFERSAAEIESDVIGKGDSGWWLVVEAAVEIKRGPRR